MKQRIRDAIKEKIKNITPKQRQEYSLRITKKIIEKFGHLQTRHIYVSMKDEVDTAMLITHLQQSGKNIFFPVEMQSASTEVQNLTSQQIDIIIVPGRAFTHDNKRLGRGKGYYDRFLAQYPNAKKIGICFPEQIVDNIPQEQHDIFMDEVLS